MTVRVPLPESETAESIILPPYCAALWKTPVAEGQEIEFTRTAADWEIASRRKAPM